jgi:hypothetical protein
MAKACGAKTRAGTPCKHAPMEGKRRCKLHGGASTGPKKPNSARNASKPGSLYSAYLTPSEAKMALLMKMGSVDEEITLTRIRLMRALALERERADTAELDSEVERDGAENVTAHHERHLKVRDYAGLIDRLTGRIAMLEKVRSELMKGEGGEPPMPIGRIEIEVVGAKHKNDNDGAAS